MYNWEAWFLDRRHEESSELPTIVHEAIAGNTFRAFKKYRKHRPSKVFRSWAIDALNGGSFDRFLKVRSQVAFDKWLADLVKSLQKHWKNKMGKEMPFGPSFKLPNLLVKRLCFCNRVEDRTFRRIVQYVHVPLDSYTLQALAKCCPDLKIHSGATMSFIRDKNAYLRVQNRIRKLAKKAKVPPIALDCLAWDEGHKNP